MATYDFDVIRKVNAVLKTKTVTLYGKQWAIDDSADGWNIINVQTPELPDTLLEFIAGNDTLTQYPFADNVDEIGAYAVSQFKALTTIYLFNTSLVELDAKAFDGLDDLEYIYVPTDLLSTYKSTYSQYESLFVALQTDYEWNVPYIEGATFDASLLNVLISMLSAGQKTAITKVIIPTGYAQSGIITPSAFSALPNLQTIKWERFGIDNIAADYFDEWVFDSSHFFVSDDVMDSFRASVSGRLYDVIESIYLHSSYIQEDTATAVDAAYLSSLQIQEGKKTLKFVNSVALSGGVTMFDGLNSQIKCIWITSGNSNFYDSSASAANRFDRAIQPQFFSGGSGYLIKCKNGILNGNYLLPFVGISTAAVSGNFTVNGSMEISYGGGAIGGDFLTTADSITNASGATLTCQKFFCKSIYLSTFKGYSFITASEIIGYQDAEIGDELVVGDATFLSSVAWYENQNCTIPFSGTTATYKGRYFVKATLLTNVAKVSNL